jgi:hypothetical protein
MSDEVIRNKFLWASLDSEAFWEDVAFHPHCLHDAESIFWVLLQTVVYNHPEGVDVDEETRKRHLNTLETWFPRGNETRQMDDGPLWRPVKLLPDHAVRYLTIWDRYSALLARLSAIARTMRATYQKFESADSLEAIDISILESAPKTMIERLEDCLASEEITNLSFVSAYNRGSQVVS